MHIYAHITHGNCLGMHPMQNLIGSLPKSVKNSREKMSLLKWFKAEKPVLPSPATCAYSSVNKKDLDNANREVKHALQVGENKKGSTSRGKCNSYTPQEWCR